MIIQNTERENILRQYYVESQIEGKLDIQYQTVCMPYMQSYIDALMGVDDPALESTEHGFLTKIKELYNPFNVMLYNLFNYYYFNT